MRKGLTVRLVEEPDLPMLLEWRNHIEVRRFMFTQHEIQMEEHLEWFARSQHDLSRKLLIVMDTKTPIGFAQFNRVSLGGIADWGFYTRPHAAKGTGKKLGLAALDYAFGQLGLHKVCGQAVASNQASIAFHKKLGFSQEGVLRDQQRIQGVYHNLFCFGLLAKEWQPGDWCEKYEHDKN